MGARDDLLTKVLVEAAANGLTDRSLREIAGAIDSSHRMLHYHFGSRDGLIAAVVQATEQAEREALRRLASESVDAADLMRRLWIDVSSDAQRPFVRLFFETVGVRSQVTGSQAWLEAATGLEAPFLTAIDPIDLLTAVATTRGLLVELLAAGDDADRVAAVHAAHERFVETWAPRFDGAT
ncbi:MAG: TetR/AcrR family transcriptional regulator [Acidimicrobiales bacterium]